MKTSIDHYYDRNTRRFLRVALPGSASTIHRAVWAPGIRSRTQAVHHVHDLILRNTVAQSPQSIVWDLGCGVGASIAYLGDRRPGQYNGVTISEAQYTMAQRYLARRSRDRSWSWRLLKADFCAPHTFETLLQRSPPDLIYMIESFGHATDPSTLLDGVSASLTRGGYLVICDDLIAESRHRHSAEVRRFAAGWQIATLWTIEQISERAEAAGLTLIQDLDLSDHVEINRPRDRVIRAVVSALDRTGLARSEWAMTPFWSNMRGGDALQRGLLNGTIRYRFLVYRKR